MTEMQEKSKIYNIQEKHKLPLKPRQITSSPSNQAIWVTNIKF
jgi:hypothetical protein